LEDYRLDLRLFREHAAAVPGQNWRRSLSAA
jgi:hypothetical protein